MTRVNRRPKEIAAENAAITQFLFDWIKPVPGNKLPLAAVFAMYKTWRSMAKLSRSELSVDSFGRLFPHIYPRKSAFWKPSGHSLKCVFNLGFK